MARASKVDLCMFCTDEEPCERHAPKVKSAAKPRTPRQPRLNRKCQCGHTQDRHGGDKDCMECTCMAFCTPITESNTGSIRSSLAPASQKADVTAAMRAASTVKHQGNTVKEDHDAQDEQHALLADSEWVAAIQAVEPLMHPIERKRFETVIEHKPDGRARAAAWKARVT